MKKWLWMILTIYIFKKLFKEELENARKCALNESEKKIKAALEKSDEKAKNSWADGRRQLIFEIFGLFNIGPSDISEKLKSKYEDLENEYSKARHAYNAENSRCPIRPAIHKEKFDVQNNLWIRLKIFEMVINELKK